MPKKASTSAARNNILEAAIDLFAERGFDGTSFRDITEVCGAKRALILYHFRSKDALWRESLGAILLRVNAVISSHPKPPRDSDDDDHVRTALEALVDALVRVPAFGQVILREGGAPGERLDWIIANFTPAIAVGAGPLVHARLRVPVVRDLVIGGLLGATALGPFLEASTAAAARTPTVGIYPMDPMRRRELVELLVRVIMT